MLFNGFHNELSQILSPFATFTESIVQCKRYAQFGTMITNQRNLFVGILRIFIETNQHGLSELLQITHMLVEIGESFLHTIDIRQFNVGFSNTTVHFQSLQGSHQDGQIGLQTGLATFNIQELFSTQICTEAGLRNHIITIGKRHLGSNDRIATMGNISKRTTMDKCRRIFTRLHQIGIDRILQQNGNGTANTHILHIERLIVQSIS